LDLLQYIFAAQYSRVRNQTELRPEIHSGELSASIHFATWEHVNGELLLLACTRA